MHNSTAECISQHTTLFYNTSTRYSSMLLYIKRCASVFVPVSHSYIQWALQQLLIVCADIKHHRHAGGWLDATTGCVQGQLADGETYGLGWDTWHTQQHVREYTSRVDMQL